MQVQTTFASQLATRWQKQCLPHHNCDVPLQREVTGTSCTVPTSSLNPAAGKGTPNLQAPASTELKERFLEL